MIFVTVGTNEAPFDRLLRALADLRLGEPCVVQCGASAVRPLGARCVDFLPFDDVAAYVREARLVICHAGVGSVMVALMNGKRPVVVPRLRRFGEAVDDHQLAFARRFEQAGFVELVEDPAQLEFAIAGTATPVPTAARGETRLAKELRAYLDGAVNGAAA